LRNFDSPGVDPIRDDDGDSGSGNPPSLNALGNSLEVRASSGKKNRQISHLAIVIHGHGQASAIWDTSIPWVC
jgi:hypothetical protein